MIGTMLLIVEYALLYLPLILGAYISFSLMKIPNIGIEAAYVFGAVCATKVLVSFHGIPPLLLAPLVMVTSLFGGIVVGCVISLLTQNAQLPQLLSGILTIGLFHGINQIVLGAGYHSLNDIETLFDLFSAYSTYSGLGILIFLAVFLIGGGYYFLHTQIGYACSVYGNNPRFFEHYDISTRFVCSAGIIISNALAGLCGALVAQKIGFADIGMGFGVVLFAITALALGKILVSKWFSRSIILPLVGLLVYFSLQHALIKVGIDLKYFTTIQSIIVLCALVSYYRGRLHRGESIDNLGV